MTTSTVLALLATLGTIYLLIGITCAVGTWRMLRKIRPDQRLRHVVPVYLRFLPIIVLAWPFPGQFR